MADSRIYFNSQPLLPIDNHATGHNDRVRATASQPQQGSFENYFEAAKKTVTFSQHAQARLQERNIQLSEDTLAKLDDTVERLAQKGARESLVYTGDVAFVVSVKNRTVITAMDGTGAKDNIITNIESAAIL